MLPRASRSLPLLLALLLIVSACAKRSASKASPGMLDPLGPFLGAPLGPGPGDQLAGAWKGRYTDSGGVGEIALTLEWKGDTLKGVWRSGGAFGTFTGVLDSRGRSLAFAMRRADRDCPGAFIGTALVDKGRLIGAYEGGDCRGEVKEGRIELTKL